MNVISYIFADISDILGYLDLFPDISGVQPLRCREVVVVVMKGNVEPQPPSPPMGLRGVRLLITMHYYHYCCKVGNRQYYKSNKMTLLHNLSVTLITTHF